MFCPEGYSTVPDIFDMFFEKRLNDTVELSKRMLSSADKQSLREQVDLLFRLLPSDTIEFDMWVAIQHELCICSPDGRVLRLDMKALRGATDIWDFTLDDLKAAQVKAPEVPEVPRHFWSMSRSFNFSRDEIMSQFQEYQSEETDATLWGLADILGGTCFHHTLPMFYEREGFTVTLQVFDYIDRSDFLKIDRFNFIQIDHIRDIARILRPFEGWAMCVRAEFANSEELKRIAQVPAAQSDQPRGGRPATLRRLTGQAYKEIYPDGHGDASWLVVLRKVIERMGRTASLETLKRAIADLDAK